MKQPQPFHILLIESEDNVAKHIAQLLSNDGHFVSRAVTLSEADELCEDGRFDLLITASKLPDGPACELLTPQFACKKIPGILIEGQDHGDCKVAKGFRARVQIPVTLPALRSAITQATGIN